MPYHGRWLPARHLRARETSKKAGLHQTVSGANRRGWEGWNTTRARFNRELDQYQFTVGPLSADEGGGYLVEYPDIPGYMSDGETIQEAIANGREALRDCLEVFRESGRKPVKPAIAQWRQRLPRTLYSKLTRLAQREGVSINSFVTAIIAEAVGSRRGPAPQKLEKQA